MNDLLLSAAFVQVNTVKGYRYLDDAGKIMNRWDDEFPAKNVDIEALTMANERDVLREIKVTADRIWLHFVNPEHADFVAKQGSILVTEMCGIIDVRECRRIGMRLQYVRGVDSIKKAVKGLAGVLLTSEWQERIEQLTDERSLLVALGLAEAGVHIGFRASTAELNPKVAPVTGEPLPRNVVLFDFDLYTEERTDISKLPKFLTKAEKWISQHLTEYTGAAYKEA